jgi:hypothetical protein
MVAHSTPKAGVEWGTQSLGCGTEGRSLLSHSQPRVRLLEMTNSLVHANLSSRPERSVVERSAVFLCSGLLPSPSGLDLPLTLQHLLLHLPVGSTIQAFPQDQQIKSNFNQAIPHCLSYFCLVTA